MNRRDLVFERIDDFIVVDENEEAAETYELCAKLGAKLVLTSVAMHSGKASVFAAPPIHLRGSPAGTTVGSAIALPSFQAALFDEDSSIPKAQSGHVVIIDHSLLGGRQWSDIAAVGTVKEPSKSTSADTQSTSKLYANAEAPTRVTGDSEFDILVSLESFALDESVWMELDANPADVLRCHLSTRGAGGVIDGTAKLIQFEGDVPASCLFRLQAPTTGSLFWIVRLYDKRGHLVADLRSTVTVASEANKSDLARQQCSLAVGRAELGSSPDIKLVVTLQEGELSFSGWENSSFCDLGKQVIGANPESGLAQFLNDLSLIAGSKQEASWLELEIQTLTSFVWRKFFSAEARMFLSERAVEDEPRTLVIDSAEPMIPWEIARVSNLATNNEPTIKGHLCELFNIARETSRRESSPSFHVRQIGWVSVVDAGLVAATGDVTAIEQAATAEGPTVESIVASPLELTEALRSGRFDLFHFVGHGVTQRSRAFGSAALQLNGGRRLPSIAIGTDEISGGLRKTRPFVFLNTCHAGAQQLEFGRIAGWAEVFMDGGAGGFLGCHWTVSDELAAEFSRTFYRQVSNGTPVAQAVRLARVGIRREGDPTWLSYSLHADPNATFDFVPPSP